MCMVSLYFVAFIKVPYLKIGKSFFIHSRTVEIQIENSQTMTSHLLLATNTAYI